MYTCIKKSDTYNEAMTRIVKLQQKEITTPLMSHTTFIAEIYQSGKFTVWPY
jgi:hypothetical protein